MSDSKRFSRSAMNKMEYGGANLVPIAVPRFCLNVLSKNWKKLFFKTISANSTKVSVVTSCCSHRALARKLKLLAISQNWEIRLIFTNGHHHG